MCWGFSFLGVRVDTKTFLTRVLSPSDEVIICTHKPDPSGKNPKGFFWDNGSFADIDDAVAAIQRYDKQADMTVYYSVGKFADHGYIHEKSGKQRHHRYKHLATSFKTLALDLDCGADKPYLTQKDGWTALQAGIAAIGLPKPLVVSSGNGIHCYWPLTVAVKTEHWEKASIALRLALEENNVQIDVSKIHDASMVLRPVGTHHKKQSPWKEVKCVADCPDYDPAMLFGILKPWFGKMVATATRSARPAGSKRSSVMSALLDSGDIVLESVAANCAQVSALVSSGGVSDAAGKPVEYGMWILGLQLARKCLDPEAAVVAMGAQNAKFDLTESLDKMNSFTGGVPFCSTWEGACSSGCAGCPRKGVITNPGQLNRVETPEPPPGVETIMLPREYFVDGGKVWIDVEKDVSSTAADGKKVKATVLEKTLVCPLEIYVTGLYTDHGYSSSTATLYIKYPLGNWKEHEMPLSTVASTKDLLDYLTNKQVFFTSAATLERTRTYLMNYLEMVQQQAPTGTDFEAFGWQEDGSFLCGETLLGAETGNTARRLKGPAAHYSDVIKKKGTREGWANATALLDTPAANNMAAAVLLSNVGILGDALGNASSVISFYSTKTTTGKTLCLHAANSTFGNPKELLMAVRDTENAVYKMRGVLNHLPGTIDELTGVDPERAVSMAYCFSEGREKVSMTQTRDLREPARWAGPTLVSCNISLHGKYAEVMSQNDPVRVRTLEFLQDDQVFGSTDGRAFYDQIMANFGHFTPEVVQFIIDNGGERTVVERGEKAFDAKFGFVFEQEERFFRSDAIGAFILGTIGVKLGLIKFDVARVVRHILDRVMALRYQAVKNRLDAFDIIGQFLQEHNDRLLVATEEAVPGVAPGKGKESVQYPLPLNAVARMTTVYDANNPVLPGSRMAINSAILKRWLARMKDSLDRIVAELDAGGALMQSGDHIRVTMYKGCHGANPGQAYCIMLNMNHPRFSGALTATKSYQPSQVALALVAGATP
jgi:hypothetical protein